MGFEDFVGEAGADFTDCLVFLGGGVVAREEVGSVDICTLSTSVERAYDDEVETIPDSRKVIFLDLPSSAPVEERAD
jgi:hypothetical protein